MTDSPESTDKPAAPAASGRCVEITTDDHGSILIAFVPVGPKTAFMTTLNQPLKGKLP
jgi:hypothetical protein